MTKQAQPIRAHAAAPDDLLTAREVADMLRSSIWTLREWRRVGIGPPYIQYRSHGAVFYRRAELHRWLNSKSHCPRRNLAEQAIHFPFYQENPHV